MNLLGEPLRVGDRVHLEERDPSIETIAFYRDTFDDRHPYYDEGAETPFGGPIAPPLLYHSEVYHSVPRWYLKNLVGNLHAAQEWHLFAPLRPGRRVRTRSTIVERYLKRDRDYVVNEVDCADEEGRLLVRGRTHQSFLAETREPSSGFVVDEKTAKAKARRPVGEGPGPEIEPVELRVDREVCWRFSGPGRNYHTDPDEAKKFGFPQIVVQGMLSTCLVSQLMANAFDDGWFAGGRMSVKLTNVLWADERIRARGKVREEVQEGSLRRRTLEVWVEKDDSERTVVSVGTASALV
jgi:acyl dehydratase